MDTQPLAISIDEASRRLGIGRNSAYKAAERGELPVICIGRRKLVPVAALLALLERGTVSH